MAANETVSNVMIIMIATTAARGHCWPDLVKSVIMIDRVGRFVTGLALVIDGGEML